MLRTHNRRRVARRAPRPWTCHPAPWSTPPAQESPAAPFPPCRAPDPQAFPPSPMARAPVGRLRLGPPPPHSAAPPPGYGASVRSGRKGGLVRIPGALKRGEGGSALGPPKPPSLPAPGTPPKKSSGERGLSRVALSCAPGSAGSGERLRAPRASPRDPTPRRFYDAVRHELAHAPPAKRRRSAGTP